LPSGLVLDAGHSFFASLPSVELLDHINETAQMSSFRTKSQVLNKSEVEVALNMAQSEASLAAHLMQVKARIKESVERSGFHSNLLRERSQSKIHMYSVAMIEILWNVPNRNRRSTTD
jgi:hypothetical protein